MFITWLNFTLGKRNQVHVQWIRGYENASEAKNEELKTFVGRKFLPLRLRACENLNEM